MNAVFGDVALPAMLMKQTALENNLVVMSKYAADHGFVLAPHGKTTMAPKVFQRQLDAGAWAITVANMSQAAVAYEAGARRVLVANELVSLADALAIAEYLAPGPPPRSSGNFIAWSTPYREYSYSSAIWLEPARAPSGFSSSSGCRAAGPAPVARTRR